MHLLNTRRMSRRTFLRSGAVTVGLPLLDAMLPLGIGAESRREALRPKRLLLIARVVGINADYFFPTDAGLQYTPTRYLKILEPHRGRFTVFSGLSHLGYPNAHHCEAGLFTGVRGEHVQRVDDIRCTVSLDQWVAQQVGLQTRISSVLMGGIHVAPMVYNVQGVPVPLESRPEETFKQLFVDGTPDAVQREVHRLQEGGSILDQVRDHLKGLMQRSSAEDRDRLELLGSSIRDAERQLQQSMSWVRSPKPKVPRRVEDFRNPGWASAQRMRYDLAHLAFQTDSTRVAVVIETPGLSGDVPGTIYGHHSASHHSRDPQRIEQLALFEEEETRNFGGLLDKLQSTQENGETLLDRTIVFWGSNLGNGSAHTSDNLPVLVAGGGFRHRGHVAFDRTHNTPLSNLYLRFLHQLGMEDQRFGSSSGVLTELS